MSLDDDKKTVDDQSFYNEALTGSGTITDDGTYADPLPDPTVERGLGGFKTSGGRDVSMQGLGDESALANRGEPDAADQKTDDTSGGDAPAKAAPAKRASGSAK